MDEARERRAFQMLQWVSHSLPAEFDPALAEKGYYSQLQRERSDKALDAWEQSHPYELSSELKSFKELEALGHYTNDDYYSPARAKEGFYLEKLRGLAAISKGTEPVKASRSRNRYKRTRSRLASFDA